MLHGDRHRQDFSLRARLGWHSFCPASTILAGAQRAAYFPVDVPMSAQVPRQISRIDALLSQGDLAGAMQCALQAAHDGIDSALLHLRLATLALRLGRYRESLAHTLTAHEKAPIEPAEIMDLANRLVYFNQSEALVALAQRLLSGPILQAGSESDLAAMVSMMGAQTVAMPLLERAMAVTGPNPANLYNRSQMRMYLGRMAEAESDLRACLDLAPELARAHWALSKLRTTGANELDLTMLRRLLATPKPPQDQVYLRFAQFNQLDRAGRVDEAWAALVKGSTVKRQLLKYDPQRSRQLVESLIAMPTTELPTSNCNHVASPLPIFIVGMHRSGTTLLERILGNHSQVSEAGELYDFPAQLRWAIGRHFSGPLDAAVLEDEAAIDFAEVGRRYLDQVRWRAGGRPFLIDKLPSNFLNIGFIRRALPQAKIVHMRRNAMDTCFSNLKELFSNACAYSYDQDELADYYGLYRRLMTHWHGAAPGFVLDVSYEELTADPQAQARRILDFCGLEWQPGCVDVGSNDRAVNTASSAQVREPIHRRNIEAWRRYAPHLQRLQARLAEQGLD